MLAEEAEIFLDMQYIFKITKEEKKALDRGNGGRGGGRISPAQALAEAPVLDFEPILTSAVPAIAEFSPPQMKRLVKKMSLRFFESQESLLVEGEDGEELYSSSTFDPQTPFDFLWVSVGLPKHDEN